MVHVRVYVYVQMQFHQLSSTCSVFVVIVASVLVMFDWLEVCGASCKEVAT